MDYTKEEFNNIFMLADRIEDVVDGDDVVTAVVAMTVVLARGARIVIKKSEGAFTQDDFLEMVTEKIEYWMDFYNHLDETKEKRQ